VMTQMGMRFVFGYVGHTNRFWCKGPNWWQITVPPVGWWRISFIRWWN
jgi:hypothetical protein